MAHTWSQCLCAVVLLPPTPRCSTGVPDTNPKGNRAHAQVNLTLIHFTHCGLGGSVAATWKALEEAKQQGLTLDIGVSHFVQSDIEALMKTATVKPVLNQCELSVVHHGK